MITLSYRERSLLKCACCQVIYSIYHKLTYMQFLQSTLKLAVIDKCNLKLALTDKCNIYYISHLSDFACLFLLYEKLSYVLRKHAIVKHGENVECCCSLFGDLRWLIEVTLSKVSLLMSCHVTEKGPAMALQR